MRTYNGRTAVLLFVVAAVLFTILGFVIFGNLDLSHVDVETIQSIR